MAHIGSEVICASIDSEICVACGSCADACPLCLIVVDEVAECSDPEACVLCGACAAACPNGAITVE